MTGLEYLKKYQLQLTINPTKWEIKIYNLLTQLGIKFEFQKIIMTPNGSYIVDFYLPKYHLVIEADGKQHYDTINRRKDNIRDRNIISYNCAKSVNRLKNSRIDKLTLDTFTKYLIRINKTKL